MSAALNEDLSLALDPVLFSCAVGIIPDAPQAKVLRSRAKQLLLCCTRQWGKSTTVATRAAHRAIYRPQSLILCVSPSDRQSAELFDKIATVIRRAPSKPARTEDNKRSLRLENGSRVVSLPGSPETIRGFSAPNMVLVDEAAYCEDVLFGALSPMLAASNGELWLFSSPYGKRGAFYEAWEDASGDWEKHAVRATDCPRIAPERLERERRTMPEWLYRQEYLCQFVETLDSVFTHEQVEGALVDGEDMFAA